MCVLRQYGVRISLIYTLFWGAILFRPKIWHSHGQLDGNGWYHGHTNKEMEERSRRSDFDVKRLSSVLL